MRRSPVSYGRPRMPTEFLPLRGVRVVDVTSSLAGPYCTAILGALGADVIKVEHPERGDEARAWGPAFRDGASVLFYTANLNKRSLALDVKRGRDVLLRLVEQADVFLQSLRPGTARRLGFGPDELRALNPRLVYCDIGAFGRAGPLRERAGYDPLLQAFGGIMSVTGEPNRPGVRVGASIVDQGTGMWAALGILAALLAGGGRTVDVSLFETVVALLPYHVTAYLDSGEVPRRHGTAFPLIAPYEVFALRDGELMIAAANDGLFARLCDVVGLAELAADPRFATNPDRVRRREELASLIAAQLADEETADLLARLERAGVPAAPVNDVGQVADHEQTAALGLLQTFASGDEGAAARTVALPVSFDDVRLRHLARPPRLGEHSDEILREAGYDDDEIDRLVVERIVRRIESGA
jgi:crotonobetainyl-CoA:carnitine CoA-transferase CaiB-like acyl-CoA transferase